MLAEKRLHVFTFQIRVKFREIWSRKLENLHCGNMWIIYMGNGSIDKGVANCLAEKDVL